MERVKHKGMEKSDYAAVYLTGAPATGKSTLSKHLLTLDEFSVFNYGEELRQHLLRQAESRSSNELNYEELRAHSSKIVLPADITAVDQLLLNALKSRTSHVIVDSHAVTKERYGYRITPFSMEELKAFPFTHIICLHTDSQETVRRISTHSQGRPIITQFQADFHTNLQSSVAISYAIMSGLPLYLLDSSQPTGMLADFVREIIAK